MLRRCARGIWRQDDRVIRIIGDSFLEILGCRSFRPSHIKITESLVDGLATARTFRRRNSNWVLPNRSRLTLCRCYRRFGSQQLVSRKTKGYDCDADDKSRKFATAPIRDDLVRREILRSLQPLRRHFKRPRNEQSHGEAKRE